MFWVRMPWVDFFWKAWTTQMSAPRSGYPVGGNAMWPLIESRRLEVEAACRWRAVARLELFGSAARWISSCPLPFAIPTSARPLYRFD